MSGSYVRSPASSPIPNIKHGIPLKAPRAKIRVAFAISSSASLIDLGGPWEVFSSTHLQDRGTTYDEQNPFELYVVSDSAAPVSVGYGRNKMSIVPAYTYELAPTPEIVVVPKQQGTPGLISWLKRVAPGADITMSVCGGARQLAQAGLLNGLQATSHHNAIGALRRDFPGVHWETGMRFVENERISTSAGLSSGIDLALRVVERYFGRSVAQATADDMEYEGQGWKR